MGWKRLQQAQDGAALVEFALIFPVLALLTMGAFEMLHMKYVETVFVGQLQKAGRDLSLEGAASETAQATILRSVSTALKAVAPDASVQFDLKSFHDYTDVADRMESFGDANSNGTCDNGEAFVDRNGNGVWDLDGSVNGRGGAKDVVLLTGTLTYSGLALGRLFREGGTVTIQSSTLLRNQPSAAQSQPSTGVCR